ncbi:MAG: hypothetical protein U5K27_21460 [Desulfotignum sp.]|nr:hypothetical protein [Desulfotignum sp.]
MLHELMLDNLGVCRFHRAWAEELMPDIIEKIYGLKDRFLGIHTADRQPHHQPECLGFLGNRNENIDLRSHLFEKQKNGGQTR